MGCFKLRFLFKKFYYETDLTFRCFPQRRIEQNFAYQEFTNLDLKSTKQTFSCYYSEFAC